MYQTNNMVPFICMFSVLFTAVLSKCQAIHDVKVRDNNERKFPDGFLFGTATASYQVEGAWDEDGKSENIWDHLTHQVPSPIKDESSGDIADDSYHLYKRDVKMMRELGLDYYRLSLSWTRILPTSFPDKINEAGIAYYNNLINEMLKYNIEPMITLYHWDLPQKLQDMGGWTNPYIIDWYADYARVAFEHFGDRVKYWVTVNKPHIFCYYGHGNEVLAPTLNIKGMAEYMCSKHVLLAHAKAYHIYNDEFKPTQGGIIGITLDAQNYEPATDTDFAAAEDYHKFTWEQYAHPIFSKKGDYPQVMKDKIATKSAAQGFLRSRLLEFTPKEVAYVRGTSDFFGLNHYSTYYVYRNESVYDYYDSPSFFDDLANVPWGFYNILKRIRQEYNNPPIFITENGFATHGGLDDDDRVKYYREYLNAMLDAIGEGSDIKAYTAWSLMDNFEWINGYTERFGLYEVDYASPQRTRTPRKSAFVYKHIVSTRAIDFTYNPDPYSMSMSIEEGH